MHKEAQLSSGANNDYIYTSCFVVTDTLSK